MGDKTHTRINEKKNNKQCLLDTPPRHPPSPPPSPCFSIINVHLVDINVFAKFYEIPSLLFQGIENQNTADGQTDGQMDNVKTVNPPTNTVCRGVGGYKNFYKKATYISCEIKSFLSVFQESNHIKPNPCLEMHIF